MLNSTPLTGQPEGTAVDGWILLQGSKTRLASGSQNKYLAWEGLDAAGMRITGTLFYESTAGPPKLEPGTIVRVGGSIGKGRVGLSVWAKNMSPITDQADIDAFKKICYPAVPAPELEKILSDLRAYSVSFTEPGLFKLSSHMFAHLEPYLSTLPAGKVNHEAIRGGLAKHIWEVVTFCNNSLFLDRNLDRDVMIFSALYHDIGKTWEYNNDLAWAPSGRLVSHIGLAMKLIGALITAHEVSVPAKELRHVEHCIMAHHGKMGDVSPLTREALVIHHGDNLMGIIGHVEESVRRSLIDNDGWGSYSTWLEGAPYVPQLDSRTE